NVDAMNGLDVTGADLTVGGTNFTVDTTGNTSITGTLAVDGNMRLGDDNTADTVTVNGRLLQTGTQEVTFTGNVDAMNGLDVTGNTSITDSLTVDGPTILGNGQIGDKVIVNTRGSVDLTIREDGLSRTSSTDQWFAIDNSGTGHVNVLINGATSTTNSRLTVNDGHWTSQGTAPTATGDGTNLAASVTVSLTSTDVAGMVTATSDTGTETGNITVDFEDDYNTDPIVVVTPGNAAAAGSNFFVDNITVGTFNINCTSDGSGGDPNPTTYIFYYHVIEND
ncbi:MAG: hypothetical protein J4G05_08230, partial [Chlorobi bacterium]|nr:hypothetical protein [Chlorobiota bacterium]